MTALYYDTFVGCVESHDNDWTRADEGHVSLFEQLKKLFR